MVAASKSATVVCVHGSPLANAGTTNVKTSITETSGVNNRANLCVFFFILSSFTFVVLCVLVQSFSDKSMVPK